MASLKDFLDSLSLSVYSTIFAEKGYIALDQLLGLSTSQLDQLFSSLGMLKGHALKLRKSIESAKAAEPSPVKKAKIVELSSPQKSVTSDTKSPTPKSPSLPKPGTIVVKEAERLAAKLADIQNIREDHRRAKDLVLGIDVEKYRRVLDDVVAVQDALSKVWGTNKKGSAEAEKELGSSLEI